MNDTSLKPLFVAMSIVVAVWAMSGYLLYDNKERGTFGDMFGAVNALFSGLAFTGLIYTVLLQRKELALQRQELEATRQELTRSAVAQEKSEAALREQVAASEEGQRLAALNNMLEFAMQCATRLRTDPVGGQEQKEYQRWSERRFALMAELDTVYSELKSQRKVAAS